MRAILTKLGRAAAVPAACAAVALLAAGPAPALADDETPLVTGSAEAFPAQPVASDSRDRFGLGIGGAAFAELNLTRTVGLHAGVVAVAFSARDDGESASWVAGATGLRLHWGHLLGIDPTSDGWIDSHVQFGRSGGIDRMGFDVGLGYEFDVNGWLRMGPFARFAWASDPMEENPTWLMAGLAVGFGSRSAGDGRLVSASLVGEADQVPQGNDAGDGDGDGDGVADAGDRCPDEPAGAVPDPERPGCPLTDGDGDGIADASDLCPEQSPGQRADPARPGCPPLDSDGDGIVDLDDACPDEGVGAVADPTRPGCPDPDDDKDGFANSRDNCPDEREVVNGVDDDDGCPDEVPVEFVDDRFVLDERVLFDFEKARVRSRARPVIAAIAAALEQHPEWTKIRIEGHSDNRGPRGINRNLSEKRARNVVEKLVEAGVDPERLESVGYGSSRPLDRGTDDEAYRRNRRVEFVVIERVAQ